MEDEFDCDLETNLAAIGNGSIRVLGPPLKEEGGLSHTEQGICPTSSAFGCPVSAPTSARSTMVIAPVSAHLDRSESGRQNRRAAPSGCGYHGGSFAEVCDHRWHE